MPVRGVSKVHREEEEDETRRARQPIAGSSQWRALCQARSALIGRGWAEEGGSDGAGALWSNTWALVPWYAKAEMAQQRDLDSEGDAACCLGMIHPRWVPSRAPWTCGLRERRWLMGMTEQDEANWQACARPMIPERQGK